jgi:tetratricopeptide (TPR) repeat protein
MPLERSCRKRPLARKEARELNVEVSFLEGLVRRDPRYVEALQMLGDDYTRRGDYDQSLKVDEQLSRLQPLNPLVFYNLACSYSLNREFGRAAASLEKALSLGYCDFKWLARDPDLRPLRQHPLYSNIKSKIRSMKIKVV